MSAAAYVVPAGAEQSNVLQSIGPNFWSLRQSFKVALGAVDIGTHMAFIKLQTGKFLVLDTVFVGKGSKEKRSIDTLTNNGKLIEAVISTHPFHTVHFSSFNEAYPGLTYYGTPRHLRKLKFIKWAGSIDDSTILSKWEHEGIYMRIPDCTDFVHPKRHFSSVFVFHKPSKTLFVDDTLCFWQNPGFVLRNIAGIKDGSLHFHSSTFRGDLYFNAESPLQFVEWIRKVMEDWDFENICTAHSGNLLGSGKEQLGILVEASFSRLQVLSTKILKK